MLLHPEQIGQANKRKYWSCPAFQKSLTVGVDSDNRRVPLAGLLQCHDQCQVSTGPGFDGVRNMEQ